MKILKSWLGEYLSKEISNEEIESALIAAGIEVEDVIPLIDDKIFVASIEKILPHPNADKLSIVALCCGDTPVTVVCGAKNIAIGQKVALALPGSKILNKKIEEVEIRGQKSFGMICSEQELGVGDDNSGIYILPKDWICGRKLSDYINNDSVFNLSISANRGDCLSHIGVSREIASANSDKVVKKPISFSRVVQDSPSVSLDINDKSDGKCYQYMARIIKSVNISPSPKWLADRLIACGINPVNNVVDITNYIMLDLGQPLHAFDLSKIQNSKIVVRMAKNNEMITTLDGSARKLGKTDMVIADDEKPIAIAGVMGGINSEVDDMTVDVVLEAAEFCPKSIRKTTKSLNIKSEASYRFERGIDSGCLEYALNKAANLIAEISSGKIISGILGFGAPIAKKPVELEIEKINRILGANLSDSEITGILKSLGFFVIKNTAIAPSWRHDINIWQDVAEEIGRVYGYNNIGKVELPTIKKPKQSGYFLKEKIKDILVDLGYSESINYPFIGEESLSASEKSKRSLLEVVNPLQPENRFLRNSLLFSLLKNIAKNPQFSEVKIFEIGRIFKKTTEKTFLSIASTVSSSNNFLDDIEQITKFLQGSRDKFKIINFDRDALAKYKIKRAFVHIAELDITDVLEKYKLKFDIKLKIPNSNSCYRGVSKYPALTRDLAFIFPSTALAENVISEIYKISEIINRVEIFDQFVSDKFGKNMKSMAFHVFLQSFEKTLTDKEAEVITNKIIKEIEKKFKAKLRT